MIDAKRAGIDPRIFAALLFLGGAVLLAFTVMMNFNFANSIALTPEGKFLRAGSSIGMDCFGAVLMMASGFALAVGHRVLGVVTFVFGLSFMAYTGWNLIGFGANERLGAEYHRVQVEKANKDFAATTKELRTKQADWFNKTAVRSEGADRKALIAESNAQIDKALQPPKVDTALPPDAQAAMASEVTGADAGMVQRYDIIAFALLCILGKSIGFGLAPIYWPRKSDVADSATEGKGMSTNRESGDGPLGHEATALSDVERQRLVEQFWAATVITSPGSRVLSDDLHRAYLAWAAKAGKVAMTATAFGKVITAMQIKRQSNGRRMTYLDVKINIAQLKRVA